MQMDRFCARSSGEQLVNRDVEGEQTRNNVKNTKLTGRVTYLASIIAFTLDKERLRWLHKCYVSRARFADLLDESSTWARARDFHFLPQKMMANSC